jgi:hypothetical protein
LTLLPARILAATAFLAGVLYLPMPGAYEAPRWAAVQVGATAALIFVHPLRAGRAHWLGAAFLAWCAATAAWAVSSLDSAGALLQLVAGAAAFCVAAELDADDLRPFWTALALAACANAAVAVAQVLGWHAFDMTGLVAGQPVGLFGNKNVMANLGAVAALGTLALAPGWQRAALLIGSLVCALLPLSRGAAVALVAGLAVRFLRWRGMAIAAAATSILVLVDVLLVPSRATGSLAPRLEMWDWTITNLAPLGWGIGNYGTIFPFGHAANDLLELVFETGVGAALLVALVVACLARGGASPERSVMVALLVEAAVSAPLHEPATFLVGAVVAGRLAGGVDRERRLEHGRAGGGAARSLDAGASPR